jgi:hypothetical protein
MFLYFPMIETERSDSERVQLWSREPGSNESDEMEVM